MNIDKDFTFQTIKLLLIMKEIATLISSNRNLGNERIILTWL
jgi:hypothetical protein